MKNKKLFKKTLLSAVIMIGLVISVFSQPTAGIKNIVIVHGAFADASGWEAVFHILHAKGYKVTMVQNPLSSLEEDVAATDRILDKQDGPTVLVGHSWGGAVITQAGVHSKVVSLVYVAAFAPKAGESSLDLIKTAPASAENGILPPDDKGLVWYDKTKYHQGFAADISGEKAAFMYASQGPIAVKCFLTPLTQAAWTTKPSYAIVATEDKSINPDIERSMYKRAGSVVSEIRGSHVLFMSNAKAVAAVIEAAANATIK